MVHKASWIGEGQVRSQNSLFWDTKGQQWRSQPLVATRQNYCRAWSMLWCYFDSLLPPSPLSVNSMWLLMFFDRVRANCDLEVDKSDKCHSLWRNYLDRKAYSTLRGGKGMGLLWGSQRVGWPYWPQLSGRNDCPPSPPPPCQPHSPSPVLASAWRMVLGELRKEMPCMCSYSRKRHDKPEQIWQEWSLALGAFHFNSLFSTLSISLKRKMCILKVLGQF